jgi:SWI/SNF-related matrix-associated actin-dependent regulator 1 of chromatin subfamily A
MKTELIPDLNWSAPKRVVTRNGEKNLRKAVADDAFWGLWKAEKESLKAAGISVTKSSRTGEWEVCWWGDVDPEQATAKAETKAKAIEASRATDADIDVPAPEGLDYLPYQRAGIQFASSRRATLIGDEMGLGKTIQAIGLINSDPTIRRVLVICPASLRLNWHRELEKWLVRPAKVGVAVGKVWPELVDVAVINYDILKNHDAHIRGETWDLVVVDEAHYLKNPKTKRTKAVLGAWNRVASKRISPIAARQRLFLTGTPIVNRPVELHPVLASISPREFGNWRRFVDRYCAARQTSWGLDVSGASHLDELQTRLRATCMIRRLKADVLTDLPPKRRQVLTIAPNGATGAVEAEARAWAAHEEAVEQAKLAVELSKASDDPEDYREAVAQLHATQQHAFSEIARARHDVALAKIPHVVEQVQLAMEQGPVVLFAHHRDVIAALREAIPESVTITGGTSMTARDEAVRAFQAGEVDLLIGNIQAAGVGITLTRSSHVIFAELDWVPGNVTQAEDRTHRIGQTESVLVQHIVLDGSLDARMAETLVAKQAVIDRAMDDVVAAEPVTPARRRAASESSGPNDIDRLAGHVTEEIAAMVLANLQTLSSFCDGARGLDGAGFSKIDVRLGHALAATDPVVGLTRRQAALAAIIARKYRRQLDAASVAALADWLTTTTK